MHIELRCPRCPCRLGAAPAATAEAVCEQMMGEGPWFGLADGATFEDMVFNALLARGEIRCPECRTPVCVSEKSLGELARQPSPCW
jgi:hypothetical protein